MRKQCLMWAVATAAALPVLVGCGEGDPPAASPTPTVDPAAQEAQVSSEANTRCANEAPGRRARPSAVVAYSREGLARGTVIATLLRSIQVSEDAERRRLETLMAGYDTLERFQREVLMPRPKTKAAARNRRAAAGAMRDFEKELQKQAESIGLAECGPLAA